METIALIALFVGFVGVIGAFYGRIQEERKRIDQIIRRTK